MRIVYLTAGTGTFYCGSCLRDNTLVAELQRLGHEAWLIPLYLPPVLDEPEATPDAPLFMGGINVYLQQKMSLFRMSPAWIDRLWDSPTLLKIAAGKSSMTSAKDLGDLTISTLRGEEGNQVKELDRLAHWLSAFDRHPDLDLNPDLARLSSDGTATGNLEDPERSRRAQSAIDIVCLSNALLIGLARRIKEETGARVFCTLQGEDSFLDSLPEPQRTEAWKTLARRASDVDGFIAVSHYYANVMRERASIPEEKLFVVHNGISLEGFTPATRTLEGEAPAEPALGYLARMSPLKGLGTLVDAFIILRRRNRIKNLQLKVAGSMTASDKAFVEELQQRLTSEGLGSDASFDPNISREEKIRFLQSLSVLSVPATYGESFGLYVLEALAAGVPVVQPRHAAFPELIEATGGGVLCEPDDPQSLALAIENLLSDPEQARIMGQRGRQAVLQKFSAERMARGVLQVFDRTTAGIAAVSPAMATHA